MRNDVLKLLRFFHWKKALCDAPLRLFDLALLRFKISVYTHEACDPSDVVISKSFEVLEDSQLWWLSSHIQENTNLGVKLSAEALEEPEMWAELGAVGVLETADDFEFVGVIRVGTPQVLVNKWKVLFDRGGKVTVIFYKVAHSFSLEVVYLV